MDLFNKKELASLRSENQQLKAELAKLREDDSLRIKSDTIRLQKEYEEELTKLADLRWEITQASRQLTGLTEDLEYADFGLYRPRYDCVSSDEYAEKLKACRDQQKYRIKNKTALYYSDNWQLDGSRAKGRAMNNDNMKMVLRAFNNECTVLIDAVKFNTVDKIEERIKACATSIDKLNVRNQIQIRPEYIDLKINELHLVYEFRKKKQDEKEALKEARAAEREQAKLEKEIEEARKKIRKEQSHYETAKEKYLSQLANATTEEEKAAILAHIAEVESQLEDIAKNLADIDYREANQRAGYVYVISNIGSFGENVYKIGMTRRLEPQDRVDELGDASVPFTFDVHAMIFSNDAPALEAALHKAFDDRKVNMVNGRKEFFHVTLDEIEAEIKKNHTELVEMHRAPEAQQFRETLKIMEVLKRQ